MIDDWIPPSAICDVDATYKKTGITDQTQRLRSGRDQVQPKVSVAQLITLEGFKEASRPTRKSGST